VLHKTLVSMQRRAMQRADIPWLATSVTVMLPDTGAATAMERSTMDRSMTAALATATGDARATVVLSAG